MHSEETKRRIAESVRRSHELRGEAEKAAIATKISIANTGKEVSEETRQRHAEAMRGNTNTLGHTLSEEHKAAISKGLEGRTVSQETRDKLSAAKLGNQYNLGRICSEETKRQISKTLKGHEVRTDTRAKMADSKIGNHNAAGTHLFGDADYNSQYYKQNKETLKQRTREYQSINYERVSARHRKYLQEHPEVAKAYTENYRSRSINAEGFFTVEEWIELCIRYKDKCAYCGIETTLTADHVVPLSRGGTNYITNILPACKSCNSKKGVRSVQEFLGAGVGAASLELGR